MYLSTCLSIYVYLSISKDREFGLQPAQMLEHAALDVWRQGPGQEFRLWLVILEIRLWARISGLIEHRGLERMPQNGCYMP